MLVLDAARCGPKRDAVDSMPQADIQHRLYQLIAERKQAPSTVILKAIWNKQVGHSAPRETVAAFQTLTIILLPIEISCIKL
jgi:hypothetical protein